MIASTTYKVQDVVNFLHSKAYFYAGAVLRGTFLVERVSAHKLQEWWQAYFPYGQERFNMWRELESTVIAQLELEKIK